jgi:thymidylate kinase
MGTINDGLLSIEGLLCRLTGFSGLSQDASISQRIEFIKSTIRSMFPDEPISSFPLVICLEGTDKLGKTTQSHLLARAMTESGIPTERFNEFDDTVCGPSLREMMMATDNSALALQLVTTARTELYMGKVPAALVEGTSVVLDRGMLSTLAYVCEGLELSEEYVSYFTTDFFREPDLTILFQGKPVGKLTGEKFEKMEQAKINEAMIKYSERFDSITFQTGGSVKRVHGRLVKAVNDYFGLEIKPLRNCGNA